MCSSVGDFAMSETAGSCGVVSQRIVAGGKNPFNSARRIVQEELHKNELIQKGKESGLTSGEKAELLTYKAGEVLDWFKKAGEGSVCYSA